MKVGSFQVFLQGFKDANIFLKRHPWPDQASSTLRETRRGSRWTNNCRPGRAAATEDDDGGESAPEAPEAQRRRTFWSDALQQSFREQLEKLVILDYIMRNTDRGLDNWMIKIDEEAQTASIVAEPPKHLDATAEEDSEPYRRESPMTNGSNSPSSQNGPSITLGAIDNSLSWPWKHPDAVSNNDCRTRRMRLMECSGEVSRLAGSFFRCLSSASPLAEKHANISYHF